MPRRGFPIGWFLFLLFSTFTLLELWVLFFLTRATSLGFTLLVAVVSALVGASLAKREGLAVVARARAELAAGRLPAAALADGVMILLGAALLITPGLITDLIGFSTLLPFFRQWYSLLLIGWARRHLMGGVRIRGTGAAPGGGFRFRTFTVGSDPRTSASPSSRPETGDAGSTTGDGGTNATNGGGTNAPGDGGGTNPPGDGGGTNAPGDGARETTEPGGARFFDSDAERRLEEWRERLRGEPPTDDPET